MTAPYSVWERMANRCARAQGSTLDEIGSWYGVSRQAIEQRLRSSKPRIQGIPRKYDHDAIAADVVAGMTNTAIAAKHNCSVPTVASIVSNYELAGLRKSNKGGRKKIAKRRKMTASDLGLIDADADMRLTLVSRRTATIISEFYDGIPHRQIAKRLGLSLGMVQRTLKRAGLMNLRPACQRVETAEDACQRLAERDKVSLGTSLHREQHDGGDVGKNPSEVGQENA